jgi:hypothetical protein
MHDYRVGNVSVDVWQGGYPVWVKLRDATGTELSFSHGDLRDLEHAVRQARRAARAVLQPMGREKEA